MAGTTHPRPSGAPEPRHDSPWYRKRRVHVTLGILVAVLTALFAAARAADGVRSNIDARLRDDGAGADAAVVAVEAEQLSALRASTFTDGVAQALATRDVAALSRLITPVHANSGVPMLDVVLPNGKVMLAVRSKGAPAPVASRAGMPALRTALRRANGTRGGRFSTVVYLRTGPTFLTIGPVVRNRTPVGAVLVMTPLADVLGRLSQELLATLTAYDANGNPVATTAPYTPAPVGRDAARTLIAGGAIVIRQTHGSQREALGRLIVDHTPVAVLGVSLRDNSWVTGRGVLLYVGVGLLCTVLIAGSFSLRILNGRRR